MRKLYPLTFHPILKEKIWGGQKLKTLLGKELGTIKNCGESWEVSAIPGSVSVVKNGELAGKKLTELIEEYGNLLLGKTVVEKYGKNFPLLIKFIDAQEDLSIQVHPNDELAQQRHGCLGKTEMWYVLQADENASLIAGFCQKLTKEKYLQVLQHGTLMDVLKTHTVKANDAFYIPAGRVHTIGKGILLAEVQQSSDITYRIYDFDRVDDKGNKRELHTDLALDALNFDDTEATKIEATDGKIVENAYFSVTKQVVVKTTWCFSQQDTFVICMFVDGNGWIGYEEQCWQVSRGQTFLIPSNMAVNISTESTLSFLIIKPS